MAVQIDHFIDGTPDPFYDDPRGLLESVFNEDEIAHCTLEQAGGDGRVG